MRSLIYWRPWLYSLFIRFSYGRHSRARYEAIASLVDRGSSLVDVCCGDCRVFQFLKGKDVDYLGLDFNPAFIRAAHKKGIKAHLCDIREDPVPSTDYVLIQGSLYQFIDEKDAILEKLLKAAKKHLIISEPVKNKANSTFAPASWLARKLSNPGDGDKPFKFDAQTFRSALHPVRARIVKEFTAANGIDSIVMLK